MVQGTRIPQAIQWVKKKKIEREGEREREEGVEKFYEQWEQPM